MRPNDHASSSSGAPRPSARATAAGAGVAVALAAWVGIAYASHVAWSTNVERAAAKEAAIEAAPLPLVAVSGTGCGIYEISTPMRWRYEVRCPAEGRWIASQVAASAAAVETKQERRRGQP